MDLDFRLKPPTSFARNCRSRPVVDRLSILPIELLIRIISLLPTKDAVVTCVLSRAISRVFPLVMSLDFDATHICHCDCKKMNCGCAIQHFPSFVTFVNTVLCRQQFQYLTKFRLQVGVDFLTRHHQGYIRRDSTIFLPDLSSTQIIGWISFPLTRCGLTQLDLRIQIKDPGDAQLPPEIFTCESLETLKLDVNLGFDLVSTFRLPNLKLCHLYASLIRNDDFLTVLVSSCPLLEDLHVVAYWNHVNCISISSPSLRRLHLKFIQLDEFDNTDVVLINTPNLEYLYYHDNLASHYSVKNMHHLVYAFIFIPHLLGNDIFEVDHQQIINLVRPLANVQHLSLRFSCTQALDSDDVKDHLPLFSNLKHLELGFTPFHFWDKVLLAFLTCSPQLETLVFPGGLAFGHSGSYGHNRGRSSSESEQEFFRRAPAYIPQCCRDHLKRIVIKKFYGREREEDVIQFLLKQLFVLEELVIFRCKLTSYPVIDPVLAESKLKMLPRASDSCSIQVH